MTAQPSEISTASMAVLLCLGKYNNLSALEYWLAHHLALGMSLFISFSEENKEATDCQEILNILAKRYKIEILGMGLDAEKCENAFYQQAKEKHFSFALRLALDEFFVPSLADLPAEISKEDHPFPALKIPYRHCGLAGHNPERILKLGLNPRNYYTKMTDGNFAPDKEGRFLYALQEVPEVFPLELQNAIILHDAASTSLSAPARKFFDQGSLEIPAKASPFEVEEIVANMWQDILRHYLTIHKIFPQWLLFKPACLSWHFPEMAEGKVLGINHQTRELCAVPNAEGDDYSRLILAKEETNSEKRDGWLCLFDTAPFAFLPLKGINARTPALAVRITHHRGSCQIETSFTHTKITLSDQADFSLLKVAKRDLPYPLAALDQLLLKGKETPTEKHLLEGFPTAPVTALWALMTRPEFFNANESFSLFSLLKALLSNEKYLPLPPK